MSALDDVIYRVRNHEQSGAVSAETLAQMAEHELAALRIMADKLVKVTTIIESGNAPAVGELPPSDDLVHNYYNRVVDVVTARES